MPKINELPRASTLAATDLLAKDNTSGTSTEGVSAQQVADFVKGTIPAPDSTPTTGSTNTVTSGGVKTALDAKQNSLTFDSTPTAGSNNPVTSAGIKTALDAKQNSLTFDNVPRNGSNNPVTSDGVFEADEAIRGQVSDLKESISGGAYSFSIPNSSATYKFDMLLPKGYTFTATNNTTKNGSIKLYKSDGTEYSITSGLAPGASVTFTVPDYGYIKIGGYFSSPGGTLNVSNIGIIPQIDAKLTPIESRITENFNISENRVKMVDGSPTIADEYFRIGNISINTSGWSYSDSTTRVSTVEGFYFKLKTGDVISLSNYTSMQYYIGLRDSNGSYYAVGWLTSDYILTFDADVVINIRHNPETTITDKSEVVNMLSIRNVSFGEIGDVTKFAPSYTFKDGYISAVFPDGSYNTLGEQDSDKKELTTTYIDLTGCNRAVIDLKHSASRDMWLAYVIRYKSCTGSSRITAINATGKQAFVNLNITPDMSAIMITFRSYDDYTLNINLYKDFSVQPYLLYEDFDSSVRSVNHMGWHEYYTQETINAYKESFKHGFKWVECDIQWTSDLVPVLLHDTDISVVTPSTGDVNQMLYSQISELVCNDGVSGIATLSDLMSLCKRTGMNAYIEIKYANRTQEKMNILMEIVRAHGMERRVVWLLDHLSTVDGDADQLLTLDPSAEYAYVVGANAVENYLGILADYKTEYPNSKPFADVNVSYIDSSLVEEAMENGIPIEAWTLDKPSEIVGLNQYVTGVTSNILIAGKVLRDYMIT